MGKFFKTLISSVKSFKSPSKQKVVEEQRVSFTQEDRNGSHRKDDKDQSNVMKKGCLWSLSKSSSRNRDSIVNIASIDSLENGGKQEKHVKEEKQEKQETLEKDSPLSSTQTKLHSSVELSKPEPTFDNHRLLLERVSSKKIQNAFRSYLARRASRALSALVRLQALSRGRITRRRYITTQLSFKSLIRLQALCRGRIVRKSEVGQLVQRHLHQTKQPRRKAAVKSQHRQDAVMKRQRSLLCTLSAQLKRSTSKKGYTSDSIQREKSDWVWMWLKRWTEAHSRGDYARLPTKRPRSVEKLKIENVEKQEETDMKLPMEGSVHALGSATDEHRPTSSLTLNRNLSLKEVVMVVNESVVSCSEDGGVKDTSSSPRMKVSAEELELVPPVIQTKEYEMHCVNEDGVKLESSSEAINAKQTRSHSASPLQIPIPSLESMVTKTEESLHVEEAVTTDFTEMSSQTSSTSRVVTDVAPFMSSMKVIPDSEYASILADASTGDVQSPALTNTLSEVIEVSHSPTKQSPTPSSAFSLVGCFSPPQPVSPPALSLGEEASLSLTKLSSLSTPNVTHDSGSENTDVTEEKNKTNVDSAEMHDIVANNDDTLNSIQEQNILILKNEEQIVVEQVSPSVPSYMATTKSSMAKARLCKLDPLKVRAESLSPNVKQDSLKPKQDSPKPRQESHKPKLDYLMTKQDSPMPKQDSPKPKQDSPKPKQDSLKPKQDSPKLSTEALKLRTNSVKHRTESPKLNTKSDPALKRRYSLSALEGKTTTTTIAMSCAQGPTVHVKSNSKAKLRSPLL